jgi:uncharacterized protein YndB with AHSA1/START domain
MAQQNIKLQQFFAAPKSVVFRYFADHEHFGRLWWPARCRIVKLSSGGEPSGVGSVREMRVGTIRFEETITAFTPEDSIEYRVTRGGPFKNHVGYMQFVDVPGGTQLDYSIEFDSRWPLVGNLIAGILHAAWLRGVAGAVDRLAAR